MPAVVTGAAGFIGGHLVESLARRRGHVIAIDRRPLPPALAGLPAVTPLTADLAAGDDAVTAALVEADVVFHLAAASGVRGVDDAARQRDNVDATRRVVAAVPLATPLIVTSSSSVYGGARGRACSEADRPAPLGGYAESKVAVERVCAKRVSAGGHVAVARPFTVVGERQRPDMVISRWLDAAVSGAPVVVFGGLDRTRDLTDVRDVVEGLIRIAERGVRATVNLGTGRPVRLDQILDAIATITGRDLTVTVTTATREEPAHTLADTTRCAQLLSLRPVTDLHDVVARQAAARPAIPAAAPTAVRGTVRGAVRGAVPVLELA